MALRDAVGVGVDLGLNKKTNRKNVRGKKDLSQNKNTSCLKLIPADLLVVIKGPTSYFLFTV